MHLHTRHTIRDIPYETYRYTRDRHILRAVYTHAHKSTVYVNAIRVFVEKRAPKERRKPFADFEM